MTSWAWTVAVAVMTLACGRPPNYAEPPELPPPATIEDSEPAAPMVDSEDTDTSTDTEAEAESGAAEAESGDPAGKECPDLPQGTCEVTAGCVWSTTEKCINE